MKIQHPGLAAGEADRQRDRQGESFAPTPPDEGLLQTLRDVWAPIADALKPYGKLWDLMAPSIGEAIADIRKKVLEEGFFGREVTPREVDVVHHGRSAEPDSRPLTYQDLMKIQSAMAPTPPSLDPTSPSPTHNGPDM